MIYIVIAVVLLILIFICGWVLYTCGKEMGELEALLRVEEQRQKEYERNKKIVNVNNDIGRDKLLIKLHDIQNKSKQS